jgi:hypothetical protein
MLQVFRKVFLDKRYCVLVHLDRLQGLLLPGLRLLSSRDECDAESTHAVQIFSQHEPIQQRDEHRRCRDDPRLRGRIRREQTVRLQEKM